jgi:hypothetical protein
MHNPRKIVSLSCVVYLCVSNFWRFLLHHTRRKCNNDNTGFFTNGILAMKNPDALRIFFPEYFRKWSCIPSLLYCISRKKYGHRIHVLFMMYDVYWYCQMKKKRMIMTILKKEWFICGIMQLKSTAGCQISSLIFGFSGGTL